MIIPATCSRGALVCERNMTTTLRVILGIFILALLDFTAAHVKRGPLSTDFQIGAQSWTRQARVRGRHPSHAILRQTSSDKQCYWDELGERIDALRCDPDFSRAIRQTKCLLTTRRFTGRDCGRNKNGTLCAQYCEFNLARDIHRMCFDPPTQSCSSNCREALEQFSERFGCCVHSDFVIDDRFIGVLTPQLWQDCGVERPEPCDDAPRGPAMPDKNISCTLGCSFTQYNAMYCKHLAKKEIDIYSECSDDGMALQIAQECGFSKRGRFCAGLGQVFLSVLLHIPNNELNNEFVFRVYSKCIQVFSNGTCPRECRDTLQEIRNKYGCCFNNLNATAFNFGYEDGLQSLVTRSELWSACGVETPGFCSLPDDVSVYDDLMYCSPCPIQEMISTADNIKAIVGGVLGAVVFLVAISAPIITLLCCHFKR